MRVAWLLGSVSVLCVLPACGSVGSRQVSQTPSPTAGRGMTSDPGERWIGAEPLGGLVVESAPRGAGTTAPRATSYAPRAPRGSSHLAADA